MSSLSNIFIIINNAFFLAFLLQIYVRWINSWLWCNCLCIKIDMFIQCGFTRSLLKKLSFNLFIYDWHISNVKLMIYLMIFVDTLLQALEARWLFQYVNVLSYLRSGFSFIGTTNDVRNKQPSVFMLQIPDDNAVKWL